MSNPLDAWPMPLTVPSRPLLGGVEVHVLGHGGGGDGQQRSTTLVINLSDTEGATRFFGSAVSSIVCECYAAHRFNGSDDVDRTNTFLRSLRFQSADAVIFVAGENDLGADKLQLVIDAVRTIGDGLLVVVDDDTEQWESLKNVSRFVRTAGVTTASTAGAVLRLLSGLREPDSFYGPLADDLVDRLGSASEPALLVEAVSQGNPVTLQFANEAERDLVRDTSDVCAVVTATNLRWLTQVRSVLRRVFNDDCAFTFQGPTKPLLASHLQHHVSLLQMVCSRGQGSSSRK